MKRPQRHEPPVRLDGRSLTIFDVVHFARDHFPVEVDEQVWKKIASGRAKLEAVLERGEHAYGVTTGVGSQKDYELSPDEVTSFNRRLLVAHATVACSETLAPRVVRAAMLVQLNGMLNGFSGVRPQLVQALLERLWSGETPRANTGASVGASDLVPLAQMALSLLGIANPLSGEAAELPAALPGLSAKEALSLMNSNAVSLGHGALILLAARKLLRGFDLAACMSWEGFRGNLGAIDPAVIEAHPQPGQVTATQHMRRLLAGSALLEAGAQRNLQDPLSFRCAPQVHGAAYDTLEWVWQNWETELNTVQDNPVLDLNHGRLISHGNMDTSLLTLGMDALRSSLAAVVDISAQRLHKLHWPAFSGLPSGLNDSGSALGGVQFLNLSHIAESFAARVRSRARPSMLSYQGQLADGVEDHATLLPLSVTETEQLIDDAWVVQALELVVASWAVRRRQVEVAGLGSGLREIFRRVVPRLPIGTEGSRVFDLRDIVTMVRDEELVDLIDASAPPVPAFVTPKT